MENVNSCAYVAKIDEIKEITGADNIEQARIGGWNCIIQKNQYNVGDLVVVATTDAVIPQKMSDEMNVTNYLRKGGRVRTVKLRGVYSECLIIPLKYAEKLTHPKAKWDEGTDMMELLGIFKYEPPIKQITLDSGRKIRYQENPNFLVYYKFPNQKNVPDMFNSNDDVQITRKIHGTNARYGIVKKNKLSFLDRIKLVLSKKIKPDWKWVEYEFVVGSHNVEKGSDSQGFYDRNVWYEINDRLNIKEKLWYYVKNVDIDEIGSGIVLYGEIYGPGIQKGYDYGLSEIEFSVFDVMVNGDYLSTNSSKNLIKSVIRLPYVPVLYDGQWSQKIQDSFVYDNNIEITTDGGNIRKIPHEGIVVKGWSGERNKVSKVINPDYLIYSEKHNVGDSH